MRQNWDNSNLGEYLLYELWRPNNAFRVLSGLNYDGPGNDPDNEFDPDYSLDGLVGIHGNETEAKGFENLSHMKEMWSNVDRLQHFWKIGQHSDTEVHPPAFFIEWALSRRHHPEWLDWAKERGYYSPIQAAVETQKAPSPFILKPTIWGIGIDLPKLWAQLKKRGRMG